MISSPIPRISVAKNMPSPSMKKCRFMPSCGSQSICAVTTPPAMTRGAFTRTPISASKVTAPAAEAQALRPARIRSAGKTAPRKGRAAIRNSDTGGTPFFGREKVYTYLSKFS